MNGKQRSQLRFNFGFLLESALGTNREIALDYPTVPVSEEMIISPLNGKFTATRVSEGIFISGQLHSGWQAECVRCLESMLLMVAVELDDIFYYPPESTPEGECSIRDDGHIDLGPLVRELTLLNVPIQTICRYDCQGLCIECGQNLNEADCGCIEEDVDPRLAALKSLLE